MNGKLHDLVEPQADARVDTHATAGSSEVKLMYRYAIPYPVPPGKTDAEVKEAADYFRSHPDDYRESRRSAGASLERIYLQKTPMGGVVVAYIEAEKPFGETFSALLHPSLEVNRYFADFIHRVHEVDLSQAATAPPPETIVEWSDPNVTTRQRGLAFTVPGIPGQEEYGKAFARTASIDRRTEFTESRRAMGLNLEVITLLRTPRGPFVSIYIEGEDPVEANRRHAASQQAFDRWFKDECRKVFPPQIDFDAPLPAIEQFFDSTELMARA
jgi:hypothetical protein